MNEQGELVCKLRLLFASPVAVIQEVQHVDTDIQILNILECKWIKKGLSVHANAYLNHVFVFLFCFFVFLNAI